MKLILLAMVTGVVACGSVSSKTTDANAPITATSVTVTPAAMTVSWPRTQQLMAMATFSDGTMKDVTATASWTSSTEQVATVAAGLVTSVDAGTTSITATVDTQHDNAALTVTVPTMAVSSFGNA